MKKFFYILTLFTLTGFAAKAQNESADERIRDKMKEYIQKRMDLTKNEAERFTPVFIRYFREWRQTLKENRDDVLVRQQRIVELRIRYRTEFRDIVGEKRSNDVFKKQDEFIQGIQKMREEQIRSRKDDRPNKRFRNLLE